MDVGRAASRSDLSTVRDALEVSAEMFKKDANNVSDYVQRHLISISIWEELRFWEGYFEYLMEQPANESVNYATLVTARLIIVASHMAGLGLPDTEAWNMIETIVEKQKLGYKLLISKETYRMLFGKKENPNLNADVLEELFLRLPLKSLGRLKSVSKEWKSILESMWFVEKHLSLAKSSRKILLAYDCECGVSPSLLPGLRDFEWSQEFVYLHCDATRPSMSYEGLVCFPEAERVNVLNPSTGQLRRFHCPSLSNPQPKSSTFREESWTTYFPGYCAMGFGRDNVKGSYKVVRIFFDPTYCDILDVNTGKWRKLWKPRRCKVDVGRKSACVNGSIYWLRIRRGHVYTIVALDLHTEEFHDVPRPHLPKGIVFEAQIVNIRDRLAIAMPVSHPLHQYELEIWSMNGQKETWSKTHSISLASLGMVESRSFTPVTLSKQGDVLFYDDEGLLFKYISEKDKLQSLPEDICVISPYVENLVPLPAIQVELRTGITCLHPETETTDGMFRDLGTWLWKKKILMLVCFLCGLLLLHFWLTLEPIQKKAVFSVPFVIIRMFFILFFS